MHARPRYRMAAAASAIQRLVLGDACLAERVEECWQSNLAIHVPQRHRAARKSEVRVPRNERGVHLGGGEGWLELGSNLRGWRPYVCSHPSVAALCDAEHGPVDAHGVGARHLGVEGPIPLVRLVELGAYLRAGWAAGLRRGKLRQED